MNAGDVRDGGSPLTWDCPAYGDGEDAVGARCFFAEPGERLCGTQDECRTRLAGERVRVFNRIRDLAATGDPVGQYLAAEITHPGQLLGGEPPADDDRQAGKS